MYLSKKAEDIVKKGTSSFPFLEENSWIQDDAAYRESSLFF